MVYDHGDHEGVAAFTTTETQHGVAALSVNPDATPAAVFSTSAYSHTPRVDNDLNEGAALLMHCMHIVAALKMRVPFSASGASICSSSEQVEDDEDTAD